MAGVGCGQPCDSQASFAPRQASLRLQPLVWSSGVGEASLCSHPQVVSSEPEEPSLCTAPFFAMLLFSYLFVLLPSSSCTLPMSSPLLMLPPSLQPREHRPDLCRFAEMLKQISS